MKIGTVQRNLCWSKFDLQLIWNPSSSWGFYIWQVFCSKKLLFNLVHVGPEAEDFFIRLLILFCSTYIRAEQVLDADARLCNLFRHNFSQSGFILSSQYMLQPFYAMITSGAEKLSFSAKCIEYSDLLGI